MSHSDTLVRSCHCISYYSTDCKLYFRKMQDSSSLCNFVATGHPFKKTNKKKTEKRWSDSSNLNLLYCKFFRINKWYLVKFPWLHVSVSIYRTNDIFLYLWRNLENPQLFKHVNNFLSINTALCSFCRYVTCQWCKSKGPGPINSSYYIEYIQYITAELASALSGNKIYSHKEGWDASWLLNISIKSVF